MVKKIYKPTIPIRTVNGTAWPRLKGVFPRLIFVFSKVCVFDFVVIINRVSDSSSPPHQFISTGQSSWNRNDWAWWRYAASKLDFCFRHLYCNVFHFRLGLNLMCLQEIPWYCQCSRECWGEICFFLQLAFISWIWSLMLIESDGNLGFNKKKKKKLRIILQIEFHFRFCSRVEAHFITKCS